jgi:DNA repair exonuclease SbcCD nuclease subunit
MAMFRAALAPALREQVDAVVHSGDLFNRSRPPAAAVHEAFAILREVARRVPVVLIPGNHDRHGIVRHFPVPAPGLTVVGDAAVVDVSGVRLGCIPFRRDADAWARRAEQLAARGADALVAHQAFDGHRVPGFTFRVGQQRDTLGAQHVPSAVRWVLNGHIHPRQVVQVGGATVVGPGSTERTAFSERGQTKGYAIHTVGADWQWRFVDLPTRRMRLIETEAALSTIEPGDLVRAPPELHDAVIAQGGWATGRGHRPAAREPSRQLGLFAA